MDDDQTNPNRRLALWRRTAKERYHNLGYQALQRRRGWPDAPPGSVIEQPAGFPGATLGCAPELEDEMASRVVVADGMEKSLGATEDNGQFIVPVMRGCSGYGACAVGFVYAFHTAS